MAGKVGELALDHVFWNLVSSNPAFEQWLLARTKFGGRSLTLVRDEKWHQRWYRDPETGRDSETDILLIFADPANGARYALHIENKPDHGKWMTDQARNYRRRAFNRMEKWRYVDFQTILMAPRGFIERFPRDVAEFVVVLSYEDIRSVAPEFGLVGV